LDGVASAPFTLTVDGTAPTITSVGSATVAATVGGTFQITATGAPPTFTYSLTGTVPAGVTVNAATGLMTIDPSVAQGTYTFTVNASNGVAPDATQAFTLTVTAPPPPPSYSIRTGSYAGGTVVSDHSTATAGTSVRLTATPLPGYELSSMSTTPSVALAGSGNVRVFTMPASDVDVHATFAKTALQLLWEQVMSLIENATFTVPQEYASNSNALAAYLANLINQLLQGTGFTVTPGDIVVFSFTPATAGDSALPAGTNGVFGFRVTPSGTYGSAYNTGTITATRVGNEGIATPSLKAWTIDGTLHVSGLTAGAPLSVYSLTGIQIYSGVALDVETQCITSLPARGVYIVTDGKTVVKVVN
jgi:hypothetical protein